MARRQKALSQCLRPHLRGVRGGTESADCGDERGTQKSQEAACGYRSAGKAEQETTQAMGLYASSLEGHGVRHHRQTNRTDEEYG